MILAGSLYILKACKVRSVKRSAETDRKALTQDFHDGQKLDVWWIVIGRDVRMRVIIISKFHEDQHKEWIQNNMNMSNGSK